MNLSNCGLICEECEFYKKPCKGCYRVKGQTFWALESPGQICPLYDCSINKKALKSCGECSELPCKLFNDLKDPNINDEEHKRMLKKRVERLKSQR